MGLDDPRLSREAVDGLDDDGYFWELMAPAWDDAGAGRDEVAERLGPLDDRLYDERRLWPHFRRYVDAHPHEFFRD